MNINYRNLSVRVPLKGAKLRLGTRSFLGVTEHQLDTI